MKRGQTALTDWIPRILMTLVAVIVIVVLVRYFADRDPDAAELHRASYLYRIHYDGNLITHTENGRTYPGVIDFTKFSRNRLDEVFGKHGKISSRLILNSSCASEEIYHDRETWEQYVGFARFGTIGPGGATLQEEILPVTVVADGERCPGMLNVTIVRPNT